jgi:hypothetical protein
MFDPGLTKSGDVLPRVPVEQKLIMNKLICRGRVSLVLWQAILGQGMGKETRAKHFIINVGKNVFFAMNAHSLFL